MTGDPSLFSLMQPCDGPNNKIFLLFQFISTSLQQRTSLWKLYKILGLQSHRSRILKLNIALNMVYKWIHYKNPFITNLLKLSSKKLCTWKEIERISCCQRIASSPMVHRKSEFWWWGTGRQNEYITSCSFQIWPTDDPHEYHDTSLHCTKAGVWCAVSLRLHIVFWFKH